MKSEKHLADGMSLVEVIVGIAIVAIVSIMLYSGVSTGSKMVVRATDLKKADTSASAQLEINRINADGIGNSTVLYEIDGRSGQLNVVSVSASADYNGRTLTYNFYKPVKPVSSFTLTDEELEVLLENAPEVAPTASGWNGWVASEYSWKPTVEDLREIEQRSVKKFEKIVEYLVQFEPEEDGE